MSVRKRESKKAKNGYVWEVYFKYKENAKVMRFSKSGFSTKKEAEEYEIKVKSEMQKNVSNYKINKITFNDACDMFLEIAINEYQEGTIYNTKKYFPILKKEFGNVKVNEIDYLMLQKFFNSRSEFGIETNKNIRKSLNRVFKFCIRSGYMTTNPCEYISVCGIENHRTTYTNDYEEHVIEQEEFNFIINKLNEEDCFINKSYIISIMIGYYLGLRISEALALTKDDIDLHNKSININKKLIYKGLRKEDFYASHKLKSKKSKAILPIPEILIPILQKWLSYNPYNLLVCDDEGNYLHPETLNKKVKKITKQYGTKFHFHKLRHTLATNLLRNNIDLKTIQELMRHSNINTTISIYTHYHDEQKRKSLNSIFSNPSFQQNNILQGVEKVSNLN